MRKVISLGHVTHVPTAGDCPACFEKLDAATSTGLEPRGPLPGDFTVCAFCGVKLRYTEGLELRFVTEDELAAQSQALQDQLELLSRTFQRVQQEMTQPDGPDITAVVIDKPARP
jgi:hypothetical protein